MLHNFISTEIMKRDCKIHDIGLWKSGIHSIFKHRNVTRKKYPKLFYKKRLFVENSERICACLRGIA
jgi:hypothetical protein